MVNPIAAAYAEKSPVVVISGGPGLADRSTGLLVHHQAKQLHSQVQVYREVTCDQVILDDPAQAPELVARALKNCIIESRPVYIEVPRDRVFDTCDPVPILPLTSDCDADALDACTDEIIEALGQARSPGANGGGGDTPLRAGAGTFALLSRKLGIPVATTFMGKGLLAGQPVDLRGTYMGDSR